MNGKILNKKWNVNANYALYRKTGDWYHQLNKFPGAYFDKKGYILFKTKKEYRECPYLQIRQDVHIPKSISAIPGYVQIVINGKEYIPQLSNSYGVKGREVYFEGIEKRVQLTIYERDIKARKRCLEHYGLNCIVCDFNFENYYGEVAEGIIEVHHLIPISEVKGEYAIDPIQDLRPICPNCHTVIHRRKPPFKINEICNIIACEQKLNR